MTPSTLYFENRAFRSFWSDGLLDLMFGLVVLVVGISWWRNVAVFGAVFPAICVSLWYPLRRKLVEPRLGYVEFSGERELQGRSFRHGLLAFFAGVLALGIVIYLSREQDATPHPVEWIAGFPLLLLAIPAFLFALFTRCGRYAWYALILLIAGGEVIARGWDPHVGIIPGGILITAIGAVIFVRFLRRHPASPPDES